MDIVKKAWNRSLVASMLTLLAAGLPASPDSAQAAEPPETPLHGTLTLALRDEDPRHDEHEPYAEEARHDEDDDEDDSASEYDREHDGDHVLREQFHGQLERLRDERRETEHHLRRLEREMQNLKHAKGDEADERREEIEEQLDELARWMSDEHGLFDRRRDPDRQHHFRMAIENLRAAGLHEIADRLADTVGDRLYRRPDDRRRADDNPLFLPPRRRPSNRHLGDAESFEERPPDTVPRHDLERAVHELHEQMRHMQAQMARMQEHLERLTDTLHRGGVPPRAGR